MDSATRHDLMGQANRLKPAVQIGRLGVNPRSVEQVKRVLAGSVLMKVRVHTDPGSPVEQIGRDLARQADATFVGRVGNVVVLYRPADQDGTEEPF
ncbi:MAG TPA: YhbY family RNA-binding protein [Phycisphaerae bacterium]|nr:YhbY family RNA-binding protein [Phycisphaerae bacterium]